MQVLVLKTNLKYKKQVKLVAPILSNHPSISKWNVDLDDCDRILRVVSAELTVQDIILLLTSAGFHCDELSD